MGAMETWFLAWNNPGKADSLLKCCDQGTGGAPLKGCFGQF
ncbi:Uncharacterized protein APZ42_018228 [Daphnia magna]|uniref:Uncharacterized protein n=1 Tax=Daphnia magna TaxID=35525 RepID=A0A164ZA88_9CRUS|nr:Uncharacterized protein APZ42_018228 [Daphnia magna]